MLNNSGESGHPSLVIGLRGNTIMFLPLKMKLSVGLACMAFIIFEVCSLYTHFIDSFYHKLVVNFAQSFFPHLLR